MTALHPFVGQDLTAALDDRVRRRGDHPFLHWCPATGAATTLTYTDLDNESRRVAGGLASLGVGVGDRVLVLLDNCPELVVTLFACSRLGAVAVLINAKSVADEVAYFAEHSGAVVAITQPSLAPVVAAGCAALPVVVTGHDAGVPAAAPAGCDRFADLDGALPGDRVVDPMRDLVVQYTSGTTARPKGVVWTHANALWAANVNARHTGLRPDDVYLVHLPLFHTNALGYSVLGTFWVGGTVVLQPKFSGSRFWSVSLEYGCTVTSMIPFCLKAIVSQEVPAHRYRTWGLPVCDPPFDAHFGVKSVGWWGMTETVSHGIVGDHDAANTPMSCGRPAVEYQLRIVGDDGSVVAPGETGALLVRGVRGVSLFSRYLNDDEATAAAFDDDGYFITGDRVTLLADGHIQFSDRDKDMLKVGGENVAASEVERVVMTVAGVAEAAVVAAPDEMLHEVPVAFVIAAPGISDADSETLAATVIAECAARLAPFKVPRRVLLVDEFPRATLNKVSKAELRLLLQAER